MAGCDEPDLDDLMWTRGRGAADVRSTHEHPGAAEPELRRRFRELLDSGINDWGGVSPVTPDHVNPEAPWPDLAKLASGDRDRRA